MRILQIITRMDSIGGAQRHVVELSRAAVEQGHELHLAYGGVLAMPEEDLEGISLHTVPELVRPIAPWKDFQAYRGVFKLIKDIQPDLVATHSTKAGILGRFAAWAAGVPDVHTVHGWSLCFSGNRLKRFLYSQIEGKTHRLADGIICVSEFDLQFAHQLGLKPSKLHLIYNGRPDSVVEETEEDVTQHPRIVSVGRLAWPKQPEQLLKFLASHPRVFLDLVGDGPREQEVKEQAEVLGVRERVTFHGHVEHVYPILQRGDIFALVSDWEGFPMSTLEAMSVGLPTVVSKVGGAPEAVDHEVTGYQVPRGDEKALHAYLAELVDDAEHRKAMGEAARLLFEQKFRLDTMVDQTLEFYTGISQS